MVRLFPLLLNRSPTTCVGVKEDNFIENLHVVFLDEQSEPWERDRFALVMRIVTESRRCWGDMVQRKRTRQRRDGPGVVRVTWGS